MKKRITLILLVAMICTVFGLSYASAADDAIVIDFRVKPTLEVISTDPTNGDVWNISWDDGLCFMGKNSKVRIAYAYDDADKAAVFTAFAAQKDPYFVSAEVGTSNGKALPEAYRVDTSQYKYMKIMYKASSNAKDTALLLVGPEGSYNHDISIKFTPNTSNNWVEEVYDLTSNTVWADLGTVHQLRLNCFRDLTAEGTIQDGDTFAVQYIGFFKTQAEADAYNAPETEDNTATGDSLVLLASVFVVLVTFAIVARKRVVA